MKLKYLIVATMAGGVVMWIFAGIYHEIVAGAFYVRETEAEHEGVAIIFVAYLVLGWMMAYLYSLMEKRGSSIVAGLKFGALIGLLWVFPHELAMAGAHGESLHYVFKNAAWHIVEQGVGGLVIAFTYIKLGIGDTNCKVPT